MDVVIVTSDIDHVMAEDIAKELRVVGYYVHSVTVRDREMIRMDDRWHDGNDE